MKQDFSGKEIIRAGETLIQNDLATTNPEKFEKAMDILSYWRGCHEKPLATAYQLLSDEAKNVDNKCVIAKRLKRTPSIIRKLMDDPKMKLRTMQDVGGCRAVMQSRRRVKKLVKALIKKENLKIKNDYIKTPKSSGYRSVHLVGNFSHSFKFKRTIEIQVRTYLQHFWATAVEIVDLFTGQAIKSAEGSSDWNSFFFHVAEIFASLDSIADVTKLPLEDLFFRVDQRLKQAIDRKEQKIVRSFRNLYAYSKQLKVSSKFSGYAVSLKAVDVRLLDKPINGYVLLNLDIKKENLNSEFFERSQFEEAATKYVAEEKKIAKRKDSVVVLLSTEAVGGLKEAYPNYFADSSNFFRYLAVAEKVYENNSSPFTRSIDRITPPT